jgi:hypothetical protein
MLAFAAQSICRGIFSVSDHSRRKVRGSAERRSLSTMFAAMAAVVFHAQAAHATPLLFAANLTGTAEIPPNASPATGFTTVELDPAAHTLHVQFTFSGLSSGTTAAHIHCCLATVPPVSGNFIVATTTPFFPGFVTGVTFGTYDNTLNLTQSSSFNPAFVTAEGSVLAAELALEAAIEAGTAYLNIHTTNFPGGEIRGILTPVPEPGSMVMFGSALLGFGLLRQRRRKNRR